MRREVEVGEQLYHLTKDASEQHNLASDPSLQDTLRRLRESLDRRTEGPLLPGRFPPYRDSEAMRSAAASSESSPKDRVPKIASGVFGTAGIELLVQKCT